MLALTRKKGESLVINNNIEITVLEIRGDQIKIGISAPKEVPIYRKEVYVQIQKENEEKVQNSDVYQQMFAKQSNGDGDNGDDSAKEGDNSVGGANEE